MRNWITAFWPPICVYQAIWRRLIFRTNTHALKDNPDAISAIIIASVGCGLKLPHRARDNVECLNNVAYICEHNAQKEERALLTV